MSNIWILLKNNLYVAVVKNKANFLISLIAPLIVLLVISKLMGSGTHTINIALVDKDKSETSKVITEFIEDSGFRVAIVSEEEAEYKFQNGEIYGTVVIPEKYEENLLSGIDMKLNILATEGEGIDELLTQTLNSEISNIKSLADISENNLAVYHLGLDNYKENANVIVEKKMLSDLKNDYAVSALLIGFIINFIILRGSAGAFRYYEEKYLNVLNRFFLTPIKPHEYYIADILSNYIIVIIQAVAGVIGLKLVGANTGVSSISLLLIMCVVGLVSIALAICIRAFCKIGDDFARIYNYVGIFLAMIGGCYIPISMMPEFINNISYFTPIRWAMEALYDLQMGAKFYEIIPNIMVMLLFVVVFFIITLYKESVSDKEYTLN